MLENFIKDFKLFLQKYSTDLLINIPALSMFIISTTKFTPSSLESTLVLSASVTTIFAIITLTRRQYKHKLLIGSIYNFFTFITFLYVKTLSLLTFFIIYEMFLLPSAALVWLFSPNERGYKTSIFFLAWTQLGSAMLLYSIYYIKTYMGIGHFLAPTVGTSLPPLAIQLLLLFGFLIKIPTFPFYFWLTKTHVEAVTSFSIFLSGFLVKIALFGIYKFLPFWSVKIKLIAFILAMIGAFVTSILFLYQLDVKKIVAYATVQEMSQLLAFFMIVQTTNIRTVSLFLLTHTIISAKFFYLADIFHRHNATRCTLAIAGTTITSPKLALVTVAGLVFFRGLPFTMKNAVEFSMLDALVSAETSFAFFWLFAVVFIGNVTFTYVFLKLLVFQPPKGTVTLFDLNKVEVLFFTMTTSFLIFGPFIFFV